MLHCRTVYVSPLVRWWDMMKNSITFCSSGAPMLDAPMLMDVGRNGMHALNVLAGLDSALETEDRERTTGETNT